MLRMGCAQADITPSWGTYLRGYAGRNALSREVEDTLQAGVIALEQNKKLFLIITCDNLGISFQDCARIRSRIMEEHAFLQAEDILISSSHTHFAPGFGSYIIYAPGGELEIGLHGEDKRNFSDFMDKLLGALSLALADLEEVRLLQTEIPVSSVAFNRRTEAKSDGMVTTNYMYPADPENWNFAPYDTTLHAWKFMKKNDQVKAVLARYGCHAVTGGQSPYGISADYVGYFREAITRELHCPAFFLLGTAGDVVPMTRRGSARRYIGETLSNAILLADLTFRDTTDFPLKGAIHTLEGKLPALQGKSAGEMDANWSRTLSAVRQGTFEGNFYLEGLIYSTYLKYGAVESVQIPIHTFQLGDTPLIGLPFEVLTDVGEEIRKHCPNAVVVSLCGGYEDYLPLQKDFAKGGYETYEGAVFAQDMGDRIAEFSVKCLQELVLQ